jgi:hypothetical protein
MKTTIIALAAALSFTASAHTIQGTLILKGSARTKIVLEGISTTCKAQVEKVKNLLREDSYGNPAYNVRVDVDLSGYDDKSGKFLRHSQEFWFNNLFTVGDKTEVRDLDYVAPGGATLKIDGQGRIQTITFPYNGRPLTCNF